MTTADQTMLTTAEASKVFGIPERTIRQWVQDGRLTHIAACGRFWYKAGEVEALIELMRLPRQRRAEPQS